MRGRSHSDSGTRGRHHRLHNNARQLRSRLQRCTSVDRIVNTGGVSILGRWTRRKGECAVYIDLSGTRYTGIQGKQRQQIDELVINERKIQQQQQQHQHNQHQHHQQHQQQQHQQQQHQQQQHHQHHQQQQQQHQQQQHHQQHHQHHHHQQQQQQQQHHHQQYHQQYHHHHHHQDQQHQHRSDHNYQLKSVQVDESEAKNNKLSLRYWKIPSSTIFVYESKNVYQLFPWQANVLSISGVADGTRNLIYSTPTSGGKTLVCEILLLRTLQRSKRVMFVFPFVSLINEKVDDIQSKLSPIGFCCKSFHSNILPIWNTQVDVALCTIEKASIIINSIIKSNDIKHIGLIVVDEIHLIADYHRGHRVESLLAKIMALKHFRNIHIQIVCMSATSPNIHELAHWLQAASFMSSFRPVELRSSYKIGRIIYSSNNHCVERTLPPALHHDTTHIITLVREVIVEGNSVIVFVSTKTWCRKLTQKLACSLSIELDISIKRRRQQVLEKLRNLTTEAQHVSNEVFQNAIRQGIAFHCSDLLNDEREVIESAYKCGDLVCLVATSTLAAGVNLPARRVIFRDAFVGHQFITKSSYHQMAGRAGRAGLDSFGESILIADSTQRTVTMDMIKELVSGPIDPIKSTFDMEHIARHILEGITIGLIETLNDIDEYVINTFVAHQINASDFKVLTHRARQYLFEKHASLIEKFQVKNDDDDDDDDDGAMSLALIPSLLGRACVLSGISLSDCSVLLTSLKLARTCMFLHTYTMIAYLAVPISLKFPIGIDIISRTLGNLCNDDKKVAEFVGVEPNFVAKSFSLAFDWQSDKLQDIIHRRFIIAIILGHILNETSLTKIAIDIGNGFTAGKLQSIQSTCAANSGVLAVFCETIKWRSLALLFAHFRDCLSFGVRAELLPLVQIEDVKSVRARALFQAGLENIDDVAAAGVDIIVDAIIKGSHAFISENEMSTERKAALYKRTLSTARRIRDSAISLIKARDDECDTDDAILFT